MRTYNWIEEILKKLFFLLLLSSGIIVFANDTDKKPPFVGDWEGTIVGENKDFNIVARIIGLGNNEYRIQLLPEFDKRAPLYMDVQSKYKDGKITFGNKEWSGEISEGNFKGTRKTQKDGLKSFELKKVTRLSPTLGLSAPKDAIVLFDGKNLNEWVHPGSPEREAIWKLIDGAMESVPGIKNDGVRQKNDLVTKRSFKDFELHLEFKLPYCPEKRGQGRANSGVFLQNFYEVQILDSYGLEGLWNECGALYKMAPPKVNACRPPEEWQTYDITYIMPRFNASGEKLRHAVVTVKHNGNVIHNQVKMLKATSGSQKERKFYNGPKKAAPIKLQDHNNVIQFRNIWVKELK